MGGCTSAPKARPKAGSSPKGIRRKISDDDLTIIDTERLKAEQRRRKAEEDELTRQTYAEKAALKEITEKLIVKQASCESLMDLLDTEELTDISLEEASFRAQKRARRKHMKTSHEGGLHDWMLYNNVDGIKEAHMVHLALFMEKVMTTLMRIDAIKNSEQQPHSKSDGQLSKLSLNAVGAVVVEPITPPSSPAYGRVTGGLSGKRKSLSPLEPIPEHSSDKHSSSSISPFQRSPGGTRTFTEEEDDVTMALPQDEATLAVIAQQNKLEEEYLSRNGDSSFQDGQAPGEELTAIPSPPPSPRGSSRSGDSTPLSPHSPARERLDSAQTFGTVTDSMYMDMLNIGASLSLRLGELISPEDEQQLMGVRQGTGALLENVRSSKSHHETTYQETLAHLSEEAQARYRAELLDLEICTIAPQRSYELTPENLYDYDLPPGLVTLRVAHTVLQLYRRGGRLTPKSVLKLLRLGYRSLSKRPNTTHLRVEKDDTLTVVGDLHGQLPDLLHILETAGLPSRTHKYIFNGDFVDRGSYGVEVVCILLALHVAMPEHVALNRGNHEDYAVCSAYGFQEECCEKYGGVIFGLFVEVFQQLPLFTIVNESVIVVHGGLFHTIDATLDELNEINRCAFSLQDLPEGGETLMPAPRAERKVFLQQLVRDALWSDPNPSAGVMTSIRGAGVAFGPDVTRAFMATNNLKFVVRSHECVGSGYDEPYMGEDRHLLCTIFSASNYGQGKNAAAFLSFHVPTAADIAEHEAAEAAKEETSESSQSKDDPPLKQLDRSELKFVRGTDLCYVVHHYYVEPTFLCDPDGDSPLQENTEHNRSIADLATLDTQMDSAASALRPAEESSPAVPVEQTHIKAGLRSALDTGTPLVKTFALLDGAAAPPVSPVGKAERSQSLGASSRKTSMDGLLFNSASLLDNTDGSATPGTTGRASFPPTVRRSKSMSAASAGIDASIDFLDEEDSGGIEFSDRDCVLIGSRVTLREFIISRLEELRREFEQVDKKGNGLVTKFQWVNVMREVMGLHVRWIALMQLLVLDRHFRTSLGKKMVDYYAFLRSFEEEEEEESEGVRDKRIGRSADEYEEELVEDEYTEILADRREEERREKAMQEKARAYSLELGPVEIPLQQVDVAEVQVQVGVEVSPEDTTNSPLRSPEKRRVSFMCESPDKFAAAGATEEKDTRVDEGNGKSRSGKSSPSKRSQASSSPSKTTSFMSSVSALERRRASGSKETLYCGHFISPELLEVLYIDHKAVEAAFRFFDRDGDGFIAHSEFRAACKELNKYLPRGQKIRDMEAILALMDFEETGQIAFNNFFELQRLAEMKLNVGIDEEDTLLSSLHHSEQRDIVRRPSAMSMSMTGFGSFYGNKLEVHGVEINIDSEHGTPTPPKSAGRPSVESPDLILDP